jgi:uncharacterized cupin superfamily protein
VSSREHAQLTDAEEEETRMTQVAEGAFISPVLFDEWEFPNHDHPGEFDWLRRNARGEPLLRAGLWRHLPEENPHGIPFRVTGTETMYVIDGSAVLTLPDGSTIWLQEGATASFSDGFEAVWHTMEPFTKFFVVTD